MNKLLPGEGGVDIAQSGDDQKAVAVLGPDPQSKRAVLLYSINGTPPGDDSFILAREYYAQLLSRVVFRKIADGK